MDEDELLDDTVPGTIGPHPFAPCCDHAPAGLLLFNDGEPALVVCATHLTEFAPHWPEG